MNDDRNSTPMHIESQRRIWAFKNAAASQPQPARPVRKRPETRDCRSGTWEECRERVEPSRTLFQHFAKLSLPTESTNACDGYFPSGPFRESRTSNAQVLDEGIS